MAEDVEPRAQDRTILIIDDDEGVVDVLEAIVRKEGFKCEKAFDGEEGVERILKRQPDLLILDLMLPRYGGFEILRQLQQKETKTIPVIVITGRYTDQTTAEMLRQESNVIEFLTKPLQPQMLAMCLHRVLKTKPHGMG